MYNEALKSLNLSQLNDVQNVSTQPPVVKDVKTPKVKEKRKPEDLPVEEIWQVVHEIQKEYKEAEPVFRQFLADNNFDQLDASGKTSARLKSEQSLYDKIANYMIDHPQATVEDAVKDVRDAFGARTKVASGDFRNQPEVKALYDAGDKQGALMKAAELQSQQAVNMLKRVIEKQVKDGNAPSIMRISNYVADDGTPYVTEAQLADIQQFAAERGIMIDYVAKIDKSDPNYEKMKAQGYKPTTKAQPSGYPALQMNFVTKDGKIMEWQFRGLLVDVAAEGEHIIYDLRTGKNITGQHPELACLYDPIKGLLSKDKMDEDVYKEYNRYWKDTYNHFRKLELGFESTAPKLADYGNGYKFDERLSADNLIALHEISEKLKNGDIDEATALRTYNEAIAKNVNVESLDQSLANLIAQKSDIFKDIKGFKITELQDNIKDLADVNILRTIQSELRKSSPNAKFVWALSQADNFLTNQKLSTDVTNELWPKIKTGGDIDTALRDRFLDYISSYNKDAGEYLKKKYLDKVEENPLDVLAEKAARENISPQEFQDLKDDFSSKLKQDIGSSVSYYLGRINNISNIEDFKAVIEAYKFLETNNVKITFGGTADIIEHVNQNNLKDFKQIFEYLKENSQYSNEDIVWIAEYAKPNSAESLKKLYNALAKNPEIFNEPLSGEIFLHLTPEVVDARLDYYKMIENDETMPLTNKIFQVANIVPENLDIAKEVYKRYKNNEIKSSDNIASIIDINKKRPIEFVKENLDLIIKYENEAYRINNKNIELIKAAGEQGYSCEDLTKLINLRRDNSGSKDQILNLVKSGKSIQAVEFAIYKKNVQQQISKPLPYEPESAYTLDPTSSGLTASSTATENMLPFEALNTPKTQLKTLNVPSFTEIFDNLEKGIPLKIEIPNEGNMKPKTGDNHIHSEDISRLGVEEDAGYELQYGIKRNWSDAKIARDLMQNFYNGHGGTLEGVTIDVQKVGTKYKVRISGKGTYDYGYLDALGAGSGDVDPTKLGRQFGEGAKIAALSLLTRAGVKYVKFASGEWDMTFKRSEDNVDKAHMTQTLTKNDKNVDGTFVEFTVSNPHVVKEIINARDYFEHPYNPDFQNFDYENEFFGIKILPKGEKGNIYVVQRYETSQGINNSVNGFSIVFKKNPDDPELVYKTHNKYSLNVDRDRGQLSNTDIQQLVSKYARTMPKEELGKLISSLEPVWSKPSIARSAQENAIVDGLISAAESSSIKLDFLAKKYVFMSSKASAEDRQMAELMGYKVVDMNELQFIGLKNFSKLNEKHKQVKTPNEIESQRIQILNEAVRVIQQCLPKDKADLIREDEVNTPKFVYSEGGSPNERAEAIVKYGVYKGHWIKESSLYTDKFVDLLATWLHEMSHKKGGDVSTEFTNALKDIETNILQILTNNPEALAKIKYLAKLYNGIDSQMTLPKFDTKAYKQQTTAEISTPTEYVEYSEANPADAQNNATDLMDWRIGPKVEYKPLPDIPHTDITPLPTTSELMSTLQKTGSVHLTVPNAGGLNPTNSENPVILPEDVSELGQTENAKIKIRYAEAINWSNFKIARDLIQNFYDGNGHTLEGVTFKVDKTADGYKIRIEGLGNYSYEHLKRIGSSTKPYLVEDLGNFGEGTRIIASSLLAKGSDSVKYGCGEWQLTFGRQNGRIAGDDVVQTLTKASKPVKGNYVEFTTQDAALAEEILNAKDYFYHPNNENFHNFEYENEYFGFKHLDSSDDTTVYLGQKYEINNDFKNLPQKLCIVFKKLPNYPAIKELNGNQEYKLSTGCDRIGLDKTDITLLAQRYAATMTNDELMQALASLEDIWATTNPRDDMITNPWGSSSLEYVFANGLLSEAIHRHLSPKELPKIVTLSAETPSEQIEYFQKEGYKFASQFWSTMAPSAEQLYAQTHKLHSVQPTEVEDKKLKLIRKAAEIFLENDNYGVMPKNISSVNEYVFNAADSNCPPIHAKIENGEYKGLFIDRKVLKEKDFLSIVQEAICQMLHVAGNDKSANYSYELTDLLSSQVDQFISNPTVSKRLKVLEQMYKELGE